MLLASFGARRPTVDADALARNMASDQASVARRVAEVAAIEDLDDGVEFLPETVATVAIRDDALYSGVRVTMAARLATAQLKLRLDINFGDPVTPAPRMVRLPALRAALAATAEFRGAALHPLAQAAEGLGELRASTYIAYRNSLGAAGAGLPERFSDAVTAAAAFIDPVLAGLDADAKWEPTVRRWDLP